MGQVKRILLHKPYLSVQMLRVRKACPQQVEQFLGLFGPRMPITPDNIARAAVEGLDITWAAYNLLPTRKDYDAWYLDAQARLSKMTKSADETWSDYTSREQREEGEALWEAFVKCYPKLAEQALAGVPSEPKEEE